jgi:hypothetical protein
MLFNPVLDKIQCCGLFPKIRVLLHRSCGYIRPLLCCTRPVSRDLLRPVTHLQIYFVVTSLFAQLHGYAACASAQPHAFLERRVSFGVHGLRDNSVSDPARSERDAVRRRAVDGGRGSLCTLSKVGVFHRHARAPQDRRPFPAAGPRPRQRALLGVGQVKGGRREAAVSEGTCRSNDV